MSVFNKGPGELFTFMAASVFSILLTGMVILYTSYWSFAEGKAEVKKEAVKLGFAEYVADGNGTVTFKWKELK